jgi:peptidoglycan/LPS O-acetylase OafA/YrhL
MSPELIHFPPVSQNLQHKAGFAAGKRNVPIDLLRGASMLYIVGFWHLLDYPASGIEWHGFWHLLDYPGAGLDWHYNAVTYRLTILVLSIFVMISGYTIGNKSMELKPGIIRNFYVERFWRLYPPLVLSSVFFLALGIGSWSILVKGLTFTGMFFIPSPPTLWFVDLIVIFYLVAPVLMRLQPNIPLFALFSALILTSMFTYHKVTHHMDHRLFIYFPTFAAGLFLSKRPIRSSLRSCTALLALAAVSLFPTLERPLQSLDQDFWSTPWALAGSLFVFITVLNVGKQWRDRKFVFDLSAASYFMYLLHRPVYTIGIWLLPSDETMLQSIFLIAVCLPFTGFISWYCQRSYDKALSGCGFVAPRPTA